MLAENPSDRRNRIAITTLTVTNTTDGPANWSGNAISLM
jgi:hypothetical protein